MTEGFQAAEESSLRRARAIALASEDFALLHPIPEPFVQKFIQKTIINCPKIWPFGRALRPD
jgi:hypothetical protein